MCWTWLETVFWHNSSMATDLRFAVGGFLIIMSAGLPASLQKQYIQNKKTKCSEDSHSKRFFFLFLYLLWLWKLLRTCNTKWRSSSWRVLKKKKKTLTQPPRNFQYICVCCCCLGRGSKWVTYLSKKKNYVHNCVNILHTLVQRLNSSQEHITFSPIDLLPLWSQNPIKVTRTSMKRQR